MELMRKGFGVRRWIYLVHIIVVLFVVSLGIDHGFGEVWPFVLLLVVCVGQLAYPTLLGWSVVFAAFGLYTLAVATAMPASPLGEYLVFLAVAAVPTLLLLVCLPRKSRRLARRDG